MKFKNITRNLKDYKQWHGKVTKDKNKLEMSTSQKKRRVSTEISTEKLKKLHILAAGLISFLKILHITNHFNCLIL